MKKTFTIVAILLVTFAGFSQRYDDTRDVGDFHAIKAFGGVEVRLVKGKPGKIFIESNRISLQDIITEVSRGTLKIKPRTSSLFNEKNRHWYIRVEVTYDYLDEIRATAGAKVISRNSVKTDEILGSFKNHRPKRHVRTMLVPRNRGAANSRAGFSSWPWCSSWARPPILTFSTRFCRRLR